MLGQLLMKFDDYGTKFGEFYDLGSNCDDVWSNMMKFNDCWSNIDEIYAFD